MPDNAFGYVPTPALVGPIEFTMRREDYQALGGYMESIRDFAQATESVQKRLTDWSPENPWPFDRRKGDD